MENSLAVEPDLDLYTIPSYSSWFQWNNIHEVERLSLQEFFNGTSITRNPRVYKEYRDFIISKYREDPSRRLTFTHLRKSLVGDISILQKVFTFLEKWGLINFSGTETSSDLASSNADVDKEDEKWRVKIEEGAPNGVKVVGAPNSLKPLMPLPMNVNESAELAENGFKLPPLASYSDVYEVLSHGNGVKCHSCNEGWAFRHYKHTKEESLILCEKCFKSGSYEKSKITDEFELIDSSNPEAVWTEAEILLLLESVLKHGDNWELVSQNVITKTKNDCISKLVQLPFGNLMLGPTKGRTTLSDLVTQTQKVNESQQDNEGPVRKKPCLDASNSLFKQVANICKEVGPHITACVGEAAISALCYENQCPREIFDEEDDENDDSASSPRNSNEQESENPDGVEKQGDSECVEKNVIPLTLRTRAATATALGAAAVHAKILADQEEKKMEELMANIIEAQMKKIRYKMKHLEDLEVIMENQHLQMEGVEDLLVVERINVVQNLLNSGPSKSLKDLPTPTTGPAHSVNIS